MLIEITIKDDSYTVNGKTLTRMELESLMIRYHEYETTRLKHNLHETSMTKKCPHCGNSFRAVGRKKFCSDSCRVKDFNANKMKEEQK